MSDKVFRNFSSEQCAQEFINGKVTLRSTSFYEFLETAGEVFWGDADERTRLGYGPQAGASTTRSFTPKFIACFSNSTDWKRDGYWVEIDSSKHLYELIRQQLSRLFPPDTLLHGRVSCGNVRYMTPHEIHEFNLRVLEGTETEPWSEIKRDRYRVQDEWRIVFDAVRKGGIPLGEQLHIEPDSVLGQWLARPETKDSFSKRNIPIPHEAILSDFRQIVADVGDLTTLARVM